ncbi:hypothetical protein D3C80_1327170 [compost metagenome]
MMEVASRAWAVLGPTRSLTTSATRRAVVKSGRFRLKVMVSPWEKEFGTSRSTVAPLAMRPTVGVLTTTLEPSAPSAPRPPTTRLPWATA